MQLADPCALSSGGGGTITAVSTHPLCALLYKPLSTLLSYIYQWEPSCDAHPPFRSLFSLLYVSSFMYLASACLRMSWSLPPVVRESCGDAILVHLGSPLRTNSDRDRSASRLDFFKLRARVIVHSARLFSDGLRKATGGRYFLSLLSLCIIWRQCSCLPQHRPHRLF